MSHHQIEKSMAVVQIEIRNALAISFAHSQYDTNFSSSRPLPHCIIRRVGMCHHWLICMSGIHDGIRSFTGPDRKASD
jgi:hypothetical protein